MSLKTNSDSSFSVRLICEEHGFKDFDVVGHSELRRACVPHDLKNGERFNVYHGENCKSGAVWTGDLMSSLRMFASTTP